MAALFHQLTVPDLWQQQAMRALQSGRDVIVAAPTGAGKTYIFELLIENGFRGKAVYTVPTRALANDKRHEWKQRGWEVGLCTGDRVVRADADVVVATLETQKNRLLAGEGPDLLVIDEYQMLADNQRGLNYEWAIAAAPLSTQLLLFSGSVANPEAVAQWLRRIGREVELIRHWERPVPLDEVQAEALPDDLPSSVQGLWPQTIGRALKAGMAPLLAFAPRRRAAEDLALELARMLPEEDPLVLTPAQMQLAGKRLARLLKSRIAYHHSGLDYRQRAGLIEPLAKAGQLRVVVATMGLAAGINFSMRSVTVTDREYRSGEQAHRVRPDELLQMFGRAGRRGMDKIGYIVVAPGKPRLQEAKPLRLKRCNEVDWPSLIRVMQLAILQGKDPRMATQQMMSSLFSSQRIALGLEAFQREGPRSGTTPARIQVQSLTEIQTPDGQWERKRPPRKVPLGDTLLLEGTTWIPTLTHPASLQSIALGQLCRLGQPESHKARSYGRLLQIARFGNSAHEGDLVLNRSILRLLRSTARSRQWQRLRWTLESIERDILPLLPKIAHGGRFARWVNHHNQLAVELDYSAALTFAHIDSKGRALINPLERNVVHRTDLSLPDDPSATTAAPTTADCWFQLGLIDAYGAPTRRGILFSFFNYGEGLALAAALEDASYPIEDLLLDLANLRAGHRFSGVDNSSSRLGAACRAAYGMVSYGAYLQQGVPPTYGEGAAEWLFGKHHRSKSAAHSDELRAGDIERAQLEWQSLLRHIASAPDLNWDRWMQLRSAARARCRVFPASPDPDLLPPLTARQNSRHRSFLRFDCPPNAAVASPAQPAPTP